MRVYLDIDIGDREEYNRNLEAFARGEAFVKERGPSMGWAGKFEDMDDDTE
jgi:hypothetical protein